jgi:hypothetical protein
VAIELLRDLQRPIMDLPVSGAMDRSFDRSRDDLLTAVNSRRVLDNPMAKQGPVLHQTKHTDVPPGVGVIGCEN